MVYLDILCRALLVVVLATAAIGKVRGRSAYAEFRESVANLLPLAARSRSPVAVVVVMLEAGAAGLLAFASTATVGFVVACLLLASFTAAVSVALRRGQHVRCRCFGSKGAPLDGGHLVRNTFLLATAFTGLVVRIIAGGVPHVLAVPGGGLLLMAFLGALAGFLVTRWDDLTFLFGRGAASPR